MKKNIFLFIISIIVLLIIFLSFYFFIDKEGIFKLKIGEEDELAEQVIPEEKSPEISPEAEEEILEIPSRETNFPFSLAKKSSQADECLKAGQEGKNTCLILLAEYLQDEEICSNIEDEELSRECIDRTIYKKALGENNIKLCTEIKKFALKDSCIVNIIGQKDRAKESDCDVLPGKEKESCLYYFVMANDLMIYKSAKSEQDCKKIVGESLKTWCLGKF